MEEGAKCSKKIGRGKKLYTRGTSPSPFMNSVLFYFKKAKKRKQILAGMTLFI